MTIVSIEISDIANSEKTKLSTLRDTTNNDDLRHSFKNRRCRGIFALKSEWLTIVLTAYQNVVKSMDRSELSVATTLDFCSLRRKKEKLLNNSTEETGWAVVAARVLKANAEYTTASIRTLASISLV
ncbi:hypothetical protein NPIL_531551 [Nephila pilipes]|uniref:Uncharacterized protein n=1 Tax=Nephila pilipes TaxID=299642 RepID=A0A8X6PHF7_NEPPI|nr:hypothetical protein NPIL_531551 [Nephila pilipes]